MLVSAATQPLSCHNDLNNNLVLSADNSIECDFCSTNAAIAVRFGSGADRIQHTFTYGTLWFTSLCFTVMYSIGVPLYFFLPVWNHAKTGRLHTNEYVEQYGAFSTSTHLNHCP